MWCLAKSQNSPGILSALHFVLEDNLYAVGNMFWEYRCWRLAGGKPCHVDRSGTRSAGILQVVTRAATTEVIQDAGDSREVAVIAPCGRAWVGDVIGDILLAFSVRVAQRHMGGLCANVNDEFFK